jgi:Flp pilus assembly protein TadG
MRLRRLTKRAGACGRRLLADKRGVAAAELGLVFPLIALAVMGSYDLALGFAAKLDLVQAAARSAELATSLGQVRTDYAFLQSEAVAASRAAGAVHATATVDAWLECDGVRQGSINGACPAGQQYARYVAVAIADTYSPRFINAGIIGADGVPITGAATVRIQ